jgi:probable HAF family extracellular repeat protein
MLIGASLTLACVTTEGPAGPGATPASAVAAAQAADYKLVVLPTLWGYSEARAVTDDGTVVGFSMIEDGVARPVRWTDGMVTDLGTLGGAEGAALDINARGEIVGWAEVASGESHAFLWSDGQMVDLSPFGGWSAANGISPSGRVVGVVVDGTGIEHAAFWEDGAQTLLASLGGAASSAEGVNSAGTVVGWASLPDGRRRAVMWADGIPVELGTLGGAESFARAITSSGIVVGMSETPDGSNHAFRWSHGVMLDLGVANGGDLSDAWGVSSSGVVVGRNIDQNVDAIVWQRAVPALLPRLPGSQYARAYDVNSRGDIVGYSLVPDMKGARPVLWSRR